MMTRLSIRLAASLAAAAAGCAAPDIPAARFANAPPVGQVDDRRDVPARPAERAFIHALYHYDGTVQRRLTRAMELPRPQRALGVNALDEVPDSSWFVDPRRNPGAAANDAGQRETPLRRSARWTPRAAPAVRAGRRFPGIEDGHADRAHRRRL